MRNINQEIENFCDSIQDLWEEEALDGDQTQLIAQHVQAKLDILNGNKARK